MADPMWPDDGEDYDDGTMTVGRMFLLFLLGAVLWLGISAGVAAVCGAVR